MTTTSPWPFPRWIKATKPDIRSRQGVITPTCTDEVFGTRKVAQALFLSPRTVEANLARVYRKLGT